MGNLQKKFTSKTEEDTEDNTEMDPREISFTYRNLKKLLRIMANGGFPFHRS
jgi:hypothetical protein